MSRNKKIFKNTYTQKSSREEKTSLEDINLLEQKLQIEKNLLIEKGLTSNDPLEIMKAQQFLSLQNKKEGEELKSFIYAPDNTFLNANEFRNPVKSVSYDVLKRMARTPIIRTVISTRVDQVAMFSHHTSSEQEKGWMVRRKRSLFEDEKELSEEDKTIIKDITNFINKGGSVENKWEFEGFESYLRQIAWDSLSIDQITMENVYSRKGELVQFYPVDGSTIRLIDKEQVLRDSVKYKEVDGYLPKYVQVWQDDVRAIYYPWEMTFGVRNRVTDINSNGYGISELEDMVNIVTWLLFGMQYNGNFFSQGSNPKGFFTLEGTVSPNSLNDFKQMWRSTITGVQNSHKVPVIESGNSKVNWIDMQASNKDMEFDNWLEFLTVISCSMFRIDPSECGFNLQKASNVFGQDGQKERLKHSQSKGLFPILKLIESLFTKYIVEVLNENFEFIFTGIEIEDQQLALDMDVKKVANGMMSMEDAFRKHSGRDYVKGEDTILNQVFTQQMQFDQQGGDDMNSFTDNEYGGDEQPSEGNPFEKAMLDYVDRITELNKDL